MNLRGWAIYGAEISHNFGTSGEGPLDEWKSADVIVVFFEIA